MELKKYVISTNIKFKNLFFFCLIIGGLIISVVLQLRLLGTLIFVLRLTLNFAYKPKIIDALNWDLIEYQKNLAIKNVIALSKDEEQMLIQAIYFNLTRKSVGILLTLFTGLRIGEFCEPQMADISLTDKTICVNKIVQRIYNKSKKRNLISIYAFQRLRVHKEQFQYCHY